MLTGACAEQDIASLLLPQIKAQQEPVPCRANSYLERAQAELAATKLHILQGHAQRMSQLAAQHRDSQ